MKKSLAILLVLAALVCLLSGCGTEKKAAVTSTEAPAEKTVVTLVSTYHLDSFEQGFEAAHPEIDLQCEFMTTGTINGEVSRRLRNGHGSDLIITSLPAGEVAEYTYDLSAQQITERYQTSMTKSIMIDGHARYLPLPGGYYGYILNKTLLDELGMAVPETSDDLLAILAAAKEKGIGVTADTGYGFGLSDIGATFLGAYYTGDFATDFLSTAAGAKWKAAFDNKETTFTGAWESSADFIKTCIEKGYMDPDKLIVMYNGRMETNSNAFKAENALVDRTAILTYGNVEMYDQIQANTKDEIIMLPCLPKDASGNKLLSAVSNNYIAVNKALEGDEKKLSAALTVLDYLSTEEGQKNWIADSKCTHSYLNGFTPDTSVLPEGIRSYVEKGLVYNNPFPTNLLSYMGKVLTSAAKGKTDMADALKALDDYYLNGSEDIEYDLSIVGTVSADMLYENANTRVKETEIGNFISDAIRECTGAQVALVNGGGIRSSLYKGDVTGEDLTAVCPYGNLIIVSEMDGATLRAAITNGIQKTWKPAGQFLQVSGIRYSFKAAANENETAELVSLTYADGTEVKDTDVITVAYTDYMGGSSGYTDAGDGFTMLNVYDQSTPMTVKLVKETGKTYCDALREYFAAHKDKELSAVLEGRITQVQ